MRLTVGKEVRKTTKAVNAVTKKPSGATLSTIDFEDIRAIQEEGALRWRAMDARVSGLAKKIDLFSEQMAELKMLVKIFEEKLDKRA